MRTLVIFSCFVLLSCGSTSSKQNLCSADEKFQGVTFSYADTNLPLTQPMLIAGQGVGTKTANTLALSLESIIAKTQISNFTVAIGIPGKGIWTSTRLSNPTYDRIANEEPSIFWWMSVGKAFTSVLIHQLINEGKLSMDDPISIWFPEIENADIILIRHLLTHTSGIYSFQEDIKFRESTGYKSPYELLDIALSHAPLFCPGTRWSYSNTNYVLLGLILEKLEKKTFAELVSERITSRMGMKSSYALNANEFPNNLILNSTHVPSLPYAAGNIVSDSQDMVIFLQAVLTGKLIGTDYLKNILINTYPMFDTGEYYGKGLMLYKIKAEGSVLQWIGHSGGAKNVNALVAFDTQTGIYAAVSVNGNTSAAAVINYLLNDLRKAEE